MNADWPAETRDSEHLRSATATFPILLDYTVHYLRLSFGLILFFAAETSFLPTVRYIVRLLEDSRIPIVNSYPHQAPCLYQSLNLWRLHFSTASRAKSFLKAIHIGSDHPIQ